MKLNLAANSLSRPSTRPAAIVVPERERPGRIAQAAVIGWIPDMMPRILPVPESRKSFEVVKKMIPEDLSRYLWEGLDLHRYSVVRIVPQDKENAVVIMYCNHSSVFTDVCSAVTTAIILPPPRS